MRLKKPTLKRIFIGLLQHLIAVGSLLVIAALLMNSYIEIASIDGKKVYKIFPVNSAQEFEESDVYNDLFRNAVSDITQLAGIKGQLETAGQLDPEKRIDVTEYAARIGADEGCQTSVAYELDNLIKWGKNGIEYTNKVMSITEFVNCFGDIIFPENFTLDEYDQLCFDGFYRVGENTVDTGEVLTDQNGNVIEEAEPAYYGKDAAEISVIWELMHDPLQNGEQFEDLAFAYIMAQELGGIEVSHEDGMIRVVVPMLDCRYAPLEGGQELLQHVNNWVDYIRLQKNLVATIESLTYNYQRYLVCNRTYQAENSNAKYVVRVMTDEGMSTYTNVPELEMASDGDITEIFSEYNSYLIYYPDSLVFMGNTVVTEEEIYSLISSYGYAYPDTTHIWIGVNTDYSVEGDAFYNADAVYSRIVPNLGRFIVLLAALLLAWLGIGGYLSVTAGIAVDEMGEKVRYLNRFDRIWTEWLILLAAVFLYGAYRGMQYLMGIVGNVAVDTAQIAGIQMTLMYRYAVFAVYGLLLSLAIDIIWYSLIRRLKSENLWQDSFLRHLCDGFGRVFRFVFRHRNSVISVLIPYNLFLFANLIGILYFYRMRDSRLYAFLVLVGVVCFDGIIGVVLFKRGGEQKEIVDGINRIRAGEVDYKLDADSLHGANRELADAVNNIGEGIGKAVKTSMKDEQMKTDLITNVSHDIKTPLTSIISYVDLLRRLGITEEPAKGYIEILDSKAQRLKQLTDDLVEASKISSGNIELSREKLNLTELVNQGIGEFSEKMEEKKLQVVFEGNEQAAFIYADSRRMWRVLENLLNNVCKYAMEATRVYFDMEISDERVRLSIKNISRQQMNIRPEELTERFIRGDSARSTEGSGLGLSIAQSLIRVQGGEFQIYLDGDLFKVMIEFPIYAKEG